MKCPILRLTVVVLLMMCSSVAMAQNTSNSTPVLNSGAVPSGVGFFKTGNWSQVRAIVENPTDEPAKVIVVHTIGINSSVQFGSTVWMPAHSRRMVDVPVKVSIAESSESRSGTEIFSLLIMPDESGSERSVLSRHEGRGMIDSNKPSSTILGAPDQPIFDLVANLRVRNVGEKAVHTVRSESAPIHSLAWESASVVVVSQTPELDAIRTQALRAWVLNGGKLWIMLEEVDPQFMPELLGDLWDITEVDRTRLTSIKLGLTDEAETQEFAEPIKMVRALPGKATVLKTLNNWPVAMSFPAGKGEVVVTTLSARSWLNKDAFELADKIISPHIKVHVDTKDEVANASTALAAASISRPIVSRNIVMSILLIFIGLMVVAGLILYQSRNLHWMCVIAPSLAVISGLVLLSVGRASQGTVPLTISTMSIMQLTPELGMGVARGTTAIYSPVMEEGPLESLSGATFYPNLSGLEGKMVRLLETGIDQWKWQNVEFKPGTIRTGEYEQEFHFGSSIRLTGMFGEKGLELQARLGQFDSLNDLLLTTPEGVMSLQKMTPEDASGDVQSMLATPGNVMEAGRYITSSNGILSDEQQRRDNYFKTIFNDRSELSSTPTLMGWTGSMVTGFKLPDSFSMRDQTLVMIPVDLKRPAANQRVLIPSIFLPFAIEAVTGQYSKSFIYDPFLHTWAKSDIAERVGFAFTLPASVLPLDVEHVKLVLTISAPGRKVEVFDANRLDGTPLGTVNNPLSQAVFEIGAQNKFVPDAQGRIRLVISVGDNPQPQPWLISHIALEVQGKTLPLTTSPVSSSATVTADPR